MQKEDIDTERTGRSSEEIDLLEYWRVIRKNGKMIISVVFAVVVCTAVISLFMKDIYEAHAVIAPVDRMQGPAGALSAMSQQFGGIASLVGLSTPAETRLNEITNYLESNILQEKVITEHNLLPVIFADGWDSEKNEWKKPGKFQEILNSIKTGIKASITSLKSGKKKKGAEGSQGPTIWDGLRAFDGGLIKFTTNKKENTITIAARMNDPDIAAQIVSYFITTLTDHMSGEARRVAETNRKYLEEQLSKAVDPITRQKIYFLLSQQVETALMSGVKENYAFKVIDPSRAPDRKSSPKRTSMVIVSFILSLFAGVFIAFVREYLEKMKAAKAESGEVQK